eukprot:CAMPEP_0181063530 /NCGR_PEP_ID=MMETSP1070-20121207/23696_1 /TAXON_ID=265543 /ORGANISM="Minutocellus polymorphus, Strain NH13" /LENGTH=143 /DNA_ID=CAMNT_0023143743 /DNA_START=395 /DNA_END=827 /DNA_ORIENTATION=+
MASMGDVGQDQPASADQVNTLLAKHAAELESGQREHAAELDKLDDYTRFSRDEWDHYSREYVNETRFALTDSPSSTWRRGADDARPGPRVRAERSAICDLRSGEGSADAARHDGRGCERRVAADAPAQPKSSLANWYDAQVYA